MTLLYLASLFGATVDIDASGQFLSQLFPTSCFIQCHIVMNRIIVTGKRVTNTANFI